MIDPLAGILDAVFDFLVINIIDANPPWISGRCARSPVKLHRRGLVVHDCVTLMHHHLLHMHLHSYNLTRLTAIKACLIARDVGNQCTGCCFHIVVSA
jgi:hypothetical protein